MAELPAPPAPVGSVEIAEEPAAGAVPVGAEMEPPPVVEDEVFFSPIVFGVVSFSFACFTCLEFLHCYFTLGLFRRVVFFPMPAIFYRFSHFLVTTKRYLLACKAGNFNKREYNKINSSLQSGISLLSKRKTCNKYE